MKLPVQRMRPMRRAFGTFEEEHLMMAEGRKRFHLDRNQGIFEWRMSKAPPKFSQGFHL